MIGLCAAAQCSVYWLLMETTGRPAGLYNRAAGRLRIAGVDHRSDLIDHGYGREVYSSNGLRSCGGCDGL